MSLSTLWQSQKAELETKQLKQIIKFVEGGALRDVGKGGKEFRAFLGLISTDFISKYSDECLRDKFDDKGFALQDLVNEMGRRIGFQINNGRYQGTKDEIGYDGLWIDKNNAAIIVEVKTTDLYRIDLNTAMEYRRKLIFEKKIKEENSSILYVIGREDSGHFEEQIRGSRYAWDIRVISVDGLLKLVELRQTLEDPSVFKRMVGILQPHEFTKVDGIIDLAFSTAEDVKSNEVQPAVNDEEKMTFLPESLTLECINRISENLKVNLLRRTRTIYSTEDEKTGVSCVVSKEYEPPGYWFAFHPHQKEALSECSKAYVCFGCGSKERILVIPFKDFLTFLQGLNTTKKNDREYWHVRIDRRDEMYFLQIKGGAPKMDLTKYLV